MAAIWIIAGLVALVAGAEILVRGATGLARAAGLSPLIIGLTVVAFGTSTPELAVSVQAGLAGQPDLALGNVLGSNIFNVLFILGISALIVPLAAASQLVRLDVPVMIAVTALAWLLALDGAVSRFEGAILVVGLIGYSALLIYLGRRDKEPAAAEPEPAARQGIKGLAVSLLLVLAGLALLVLGAGWLVDGAVSLARTLGVSELVIGLTVVAAGTSMPEVATSIMASLRGQRDLAVGNVVGSNIFNLLAVLGGTALVAEAGVPVAGSALRFEMPVTFAVAVVCLPILFTGGRISRWEGALLLGYYGVYLAFLLLAATGHEALAGFTQAMLWFVLPLTALGIAVSVATWVRRKHTKTRPTR